MDYFAMCRRVKNDRTIRSAFRHAGGEMVELEEEIAKVENDEKAGVDGIIGEATDVIACMLDIIAQHDPSISKEEWEDRFFKPKMAKWERVYGK